MAAPPVGKKSSTPISTSRPRLRAQPRPRPRLGRLGSALLGSAQVSSAWLCARPGSTPLGSSRLASGRARLGLGSARHRHLVPKRDRTTHTLQNKTVSVHRLAKNRAHRLAKNLRQRFANNVHAHVHIHVHTHVHIYIHIHKHKSPSTGSQDRIGPIERQTLNQVRSALGLGLS